MNIFIFIELYTHCLESCNANFEQNMCVLIYLFMYLNGDNKKPVISKMKQL